MASPEDVRARQVRALERLKIVTRLDQHAGNHIGISATSAMIVAMSYHILKPILLQLPRDPAAYHEVDFALTGATAAVLAEWRDLIEVLLCLTPEHDGTKLGSPFERAERLARLLPLSMEQIELLEATR